VSSDAAEVERAPFRRRAMREERDALGPVAVPEGRLWGAETERSRTHFAIGDDGVRRWPRHVLRAFGVVKGAAAAANREVGELDEQRASLIVAAAAEVAAGDWDHEFPVGVYQTGSGTHSNMNANEVIANRANLLAGEPLGRYRPVHPHDHVNRGQSSNDVFPAVMHLATLDAVDALLLGVDRVRAALSAHARDWADLPMIARTHLQDATPIMLGDVVAGWLAHVDDATRRLASTRDGLHELPLGATAVGTGLNAHREFGRRAVAHVARLSGRAVRPAQHPVAALAGHDAMAAVSAAQRALATALFKVANDIRLYASGPDTGFGELILPANEPGSSIMPGKVNPSQCEAMTMVAVQVFGLDTAVAMANAHGQLQLNVYKPLILHDVLHAARLLDDACVSFARHCLDGMAPHRARIDAHLHASLMLGTALVPHIGHDAAAAIALAAHREGKSLRDAAIASGQVSAAQFDQWVRPADMARPHRPTS
jgi:fumarate hydratase, class II